MGDRNIRARSITGVNPTQNIICNVLNLTNQIQINGSVPTTQHFLAYDPTTKTTKYIAISTISDDLNVEGDLFVDGEAFLYGGINTGGTQVSCGGLNATGATIRFTNLPTTDPSNSGQLWNDSGTLKVSA